MFVRARPRRRRAQRCAAGASARRYPQPARRGDGVGGSDDKVELRTLKADRAIGDKWLVTDGLKAGDRVIVTGLMKVQPGAQVKVQEVDTQAQNSRSLKAVVIKGAVIHG